MEKEQLIKKINQATSYPQVSYLHGYATALHDNKIITISEFSELSVIISEKQLKLMGMILNG